MSSRINRILAHLSCTEEPGTIGLRADCCFKQELSRIKLSDSTVRQFWDEGFVLVENVLPLKWVEELKTRFEALFSGNFDTGIYPDEWHWREGISKPEAFREIVNAWKSDTVVSSIVRSHRIGCLAKDVMKWDCGVRIAQDDILWKPPQSGGVGYHQDAPYISSQFTPLENNSVTIWIALDDADESTGVVEYAKRSHLWPNKPKASVAESSFHGEEDHLAALKKNKPESMNDTLEIVKLKVKAGDALLHHQNCWHGSGKNKSISNPRRALGIHLIRSDVKWRMERKPDYIYGRYYIPGEDTPREEFFPIILP